MEPSWWKGLEGRRFLLVATLLLFLYYYHNILNYFVEAQLIWHTVWSDFTLCTIRASLWFSLDRLMSDNTYSDTHPAGDSGMLVSPPPEVLRSQRKLVLRWPCKVLGSTCPWVIRPFVVACTSIGRSVPCHGLLTISQWVMCLMFC